MLTGKKRARTRNGHENFEGENLCGKTLRFPSLFSHISLFYFCPPLFFNAPPPRSLGAQRRRRLSDGRGTSHPGRSPRHGGGGAAPRAALCQGPERRWSLRADCIIADFIVIDFAVAELRAARPRLREDRVRRGDQCECFLRVSMGIERGQSVRNALGRKLPREGSVGGGCTVGGLARRGRRFEKR